MPKCCWNDKHGSYFTLILHMTWTIHRYVGYEKWDVLVLALLSWFFKMTYISVKSHVLPSDCYHGCSWIGTYSFCPRLLILERTMCAKTREGSSVTRLKSTRATMVTCVDLFWRTPTWSVVEGSSCSLSLTTCFCHLSSCHYVIMIWTLLK